MSAHHKITQIIYSREIRPEEETRLKSMEHAIIKTLSDHSIPPRPMWTTNSRSGPRSLQLYAFIKGAPQALVEIPADQIDSLSEEKLISQIKVYISKIW